MNLTGNGEGNTVLIITGEESMAMRKFLTWSAQNADPMGLGDTAAGNALEAFNRGIQRGTEKLQAELSASLKASSNGRAKGSER